MRYQIFKDGELINTIAAEADFAESYCAENGYTYEVEVLPEPEPVPEPEKELSVWDELDAAYQEGVDSV